MDFQKKSRTCSPRGRGRSRQKGGGIGMSPAIDSQYKDLLNPVKDLEKSFAINIQDLLHNFLQEFAQNSALPNFNSAALVLQGSASVYGKKVEYLHNLATHLHNSLLKQKNNDPQQVKKDTKEKEKKVEKLSDPFLAVDFKIGKNLSCLKKKAFSKATNKMSLKKNKSTAIPIHLLSNDNEDKGEVFYDTVGEVVGNKGDFAMNKCRLITSGWLLLPTVNPNLVPSVEAVLDNYDDLDFEEPCEINIDDLDDPIEPVVNSDEGFESAPTSVERQGSSPNTVDGSEGAPSNSIPSTDEGISVPAEGNENVPAENDGGDSNTAPQPIRRAHRRALTACQLAVEDDPLAGIAIDKELLVRKKIQKNKVFCLPAKLRLEDGDEEELPAIAFYCARTYFAIEENNLIKQSLLNFGVPGFNQNDKFVDRILKRLSALKISNKEKAIDPIEDEQEINVEEIETLQDANEEDENIFPLFDDNDIHINHDRMLLPLDTSPPVLDDDEINAEAIPEVPVEDLPSADITHVEHEQHIKDLQAFIQNSDITKRVHEWEKRVKPFLDELDQRESFDINLYGSRILNAFEDSNRKQTMTFRKFCENKEKWEIHRYFMALLPLANIGNVSIDPEPKPDGTEEIFVSLLSRKMHHKELEEFGHNDGSHP